MCHDAGVAFYQRYINASTCARGNLCLAAGGDIDYGVIQQGDGFNNFNTYVRSSVTDRALLSAQSYLAGVFPAVPAWSNATAYLPTGQQPVPVYMAAGSDKDDTLVRAYTKCPVYDAQLASWYASPEFKAKEVESAGMRAAIEAATPVGLGLEFGLASWWNVYDAYNVWRAYGVGDAMPDIPQTLFEQARALAVWLELSKGASARDPDALLGGPLLSDAVRYMQAAVDARAQGDATYYRLLVVSGHYNVQLAVLAALRLDTHAAARAALAWLNPANGTLPAPASSLVLELHGGSGTAAPATGPLSVGVGVNVREDNTAVRLVVQDGPTRPFVTIPLPCAVPGDAAEALAGPGACTLAAFKRAAAAGLAVGQPDRWCAACSNADAAPCAWARVTAELAARQVRQGGDCSGTEQRLRVGVGVGVTLSFLTAAALTALGATLWFRRWRQQQGAVWGEEPGRMVPGGPSSHVGVAMTGRQGGKAGDSAYAPPKALLGTSV